MIRIALTGSIGMGKSTVAAMFEREGIPVFDADLEVHRLQGEGGALLPAIARRFPGTVVNGTLDRAGLAARVLGDPGELAALEAIVHPAVQLARDDFIAAHAGAPALVFDIPLLFETAGEAAFDKVVVVSAPAEVQRERVMRRAGMTVEKFGAIVARQMSDADKKARADWVIDTSGLLEQTAAQVRSIVALLMGPSER